MGASDRKQSKLAREEPESWEPEVSPISASAYSDPCPKLADIEIKECNPAIAGIKTFQNGTGNYCRCSLMAKPFFLHGLVGTGFIGVL
jgi:hypothetical protein